MMSMTNEKLHSCEFKDAIDDTSCKKLQNIKICPSKCRYFVHENYKAVDFGKPQVTFVGPGKVIPFARDLFIPNFYECIKCQVHSLDVSVVDLNKINVDVSFTLKSNVNREISNNEVYGVDKWKIDAVEMDDGYAPILGVYTLSDDPIKVLSSKCKILDRDADIKRVGNILYTWLPYSKEEIRPISVKDMPEFSNTDFIQGTVCEGNHFIGRNNCLYAHFCLNQKYQLSFECFYSNANKKNEITHLMLGLFFPFPLVEYDDFSYYLSEGLEVLRESEIKFMFPLNDKNEKLFWIPLQGNTQDIYASNITRLPLTPNNKHFCYDKYIIFLMHFKIQMHEELLISNKWSELPVLLGIYGPVNQLHENKYAPIKLTINNNSPYIKQVRAVYFIDEITGVNTQELVLKAHEENVFYLAPTLLDEKIETIHEVTRKIFRIQIFTKEGICMWDNSKEIEIWPRETFLHELKNDGYDWQLDLDSYIARWVTPNSKCIEELIARAGIETGMRGIYASSEDKMMGEMKSLYDEISKDIRYISRSLSFADSGKGQRVCLPSTTLKLKSGNCIDLSVLLASCFEALRYDVELALIKGHAFIVIRFSETHFECIESTFMGEYEFYEALTRGREIYDENFTLNGGSKKKDSILVNIKHSRKVNILPME